MSARTLYQKIWDSHVVHRYDDGACLVYIDRHLVHEVTSPQAFEGIIQAGRRVRRPDAALAMPDHNVSTAPGRNHRAIKDSDSALQLATLTDNVARHGIPFIPMTDRRQGIVHIVGPEQGLTQPGMTIVCGDSHTATHGAFGALAFGIGTSEVEHVLATQCLRLNPAKTMRITVNGQLPLGVTAKDVILAVIGQIGTAGGTGYVIEYAGEAITALSMEGRMTICNMSIEAGARAGLIAPDETTYAYLRGRPMAPSAMHWDAAVNYWSALASDPGATYDREVTLHAAKIAPHITWGTSPGDVTTIDGTVPEIPQHATPQQQAAFARKLEYMGLQQGQKLAGLPVDVVFIGSCTNGRIEDLRAAAQVVKGHKVANGVRALVVPGSGLVQQQAEAEGLGQIFIDSGFEWREPGCSMCLGMNEDQVGAGQRCAATSNRNFEGRQGRGARTHLLSPAMAAAAAITGSLCDIRQWEQKGQ